MNVFWFRRDLRLEDNRGLHQALSNGKVLPIFIFDKNILSELPADDARVTFIFDCLANIDRELKNYGSSLAVFHDEPQLVFTRLVRENRITAVYANEDYEPYATQRDGIIRGLLRVQDVAFHTFKDQVIFEKDEIAKADGTPYVVYTPYANRWKNHFNTKSLKAYKSKELLKNIVPHLYPFLTLSDIGFERSGIALPPMDLSGNLIGHYGQTRNFPSQQTSRAGVHLRFGTISIRTVAAMADQCANKTFLNELIWREFFMQILWHFPHTVTRSFRPMYDKIKWRNDEREFALWCAGQTGYPMVDAGMRELNATGFMHNRVRMVTASFLCKHLLVDWRWGEAYFAAKLLDYDQAANVGNWQWAAGSGVDAAPYFRIFNPAQQVKKFDSHLAYIKKWLPELGTPDYPLPIVDHAFAREQCLTVYKDALA